MAAAPNRPKAAGGGVAAALGKLVAVADTEAMSEANRLEAAAMTDGAGDGVASYAKQMFSVVLVPSREVRDQLCSTTRQRLTVEAFFETAITV